jgi:hypothetical protein
MDKKKLCKIGWDGENLLLLTNKNEILSSQTGIKITNNIEELPYAEVELFINLDEVVDLRDRKTEIKGNLLTRFIRKYFYNG